MVTVLVFGLTLRDAVGETEFEIEVSEPTTVRKLIESNQDRMGPLVQFLLNREVMIAVNKKVSAEDTVIKDGDIVKLSHQSRTSYDGTRDIPIYSRMLKNPLVSPAQPRRLFHPPTLRLPGSLFALRRASSHASFSP